MAYADIGATSVGQIKTAAFFNQIRDNFDTLKSLANDGTLAWDNANQRLGIGTATPAERLHLQSPGNSAALYETTGAAYQSYISLKTPVRRWQLTAAGSSYLPNTFYIYEETGNAVRLMITPTGSVLLGKTSGLTGAGDLDVAGSVAVGGAFQHNGSYISFFNVGGGATKGTVIGSRGGNIALANLLQTLTAYGLIVNSTTA